MRGVDLGGPHPPTLSPHRLANPLDFAKASLEDVVVVDDVVQVLVLGSNDARALSVQVVWREAVVRHARLPLSAVQCAYDSANTRR